MFLMVSRKIYINAQDLYNIRKIVLILIAKTLKEGKPLTKYTLF